MIIQISHPICLYYTLLPNNNSGQKIFRTPVISDFNAGLYETYVGPIVCLKKASKVINRGGLSKMSTELCDA